MWIMTPLGFYSVVRANKGQVQIRARSKKDLQRLQRRFKQQQVTAKIITTELADYPFRMIVKTEAWAKQAAKFAREAEQYRNFKDRVDQVNKDRADLYHEVWALLRRIEQEHKPVIMLSRGAQQSKSQLKRLQAQGAPDPERRRP